MRQQNLRLLNDGQSACWTGDDSRSRNSRWLQSVSHLDPRFGGICALIPRFCESATVRGKQVSVAAFCDEGEDSREIEQRGIPIARFPRERLEWHRARRHRERFGEMVGAVDGLHIHGLWGQHCATAGVLAYSRQKPFIVSAHGMLERWAVKHKSLKKAIYSLIFEKPNLRRAACLHALTRAEVDDYRRFGLNNPVVLIPNGVDVPESVSPEMFLNAYPQLRGKRLIIFLSRIHYKKGLDILCKAWKRVQVKVPEARLVIAGPDCENTRQKLESWIDELGIGCSVLLPGMLANAMKWSALAAAELFVLPSYSEGFSVAVLEALGAGIPVLISRPCHFPEVGETGCGIVIDATVAELEYALMQLLKGNRSELAQMGERGRRLVAARHSWSAVGDQISSTYDWVLGGSEPGTVPIF